MTRRLLIALSLLGLVLALPIVAFGDVVVGSGGGTPGTSLNFQLVGHNDLSGFELDGNTVPRGMNAALAIYVYIGNRTDGSSTCGSLTSPTRPTRPSSARSGRRLPTRSESRPASCASGRGRSC